MHKYAFEMSAETRGPVSHKASSLQGEVEQIAMMKPKAQGPHDEGLLEYLSDIIGCDHYNEQIDQASQR